jgi:Fic family protein
MFQPHYHISQTLLATLKGIAVQVYALNKQRPIEATVTALRERALDLAAAAAGRDDDLSRANYRRTLLELGSSPATGFDLALLLRSHFRLNGGILPDEQRGRLRRDEPAGAVGKMLSWWALYQPPEPKVVPVLLNDLVAFVEAQRATLDPLLLAGIFHRQLMLIRPFRSGNEPVAWLASRILLSGLELERMDLLALEHPFQADREGYLAALGARGNYYGLANVLEFTPWLEYFAQGIEAGLADLAECYRQRRATPDKTLQSHDRALLEYVDEHGFITDKQYARLTDRAKATRSLDFKKLMDLGLLVREGRGRGTYYRRRT